jgi:tripartite-type tricarboxylate transporter receptor subunit TctC
MSSAVPGFNASTWVAVFAPSGTPPALVQRYNREINEVAKTKVVTEQLRADGAVGTPLTPDEVAPKVRATYAMWKRLALDKKIVVE